MIAQVSFIFVGIILTLCKAGMTEEERVKIWRTKHTWPPVYHLLAGCFVFNS
jgi:hypothetical protein